MNGVFAKWKARSPKIFFRLATFRDRFHQWRSALFTNNEYITVVWHCKKFWGVCLSHFLTHFSAEKKTLTNTPCHSTNEKWVGTKLWIKRVPTNLMFRDWIPFRIFFTVSFLQFKIILVIQIYIFWEHVTKGITYHVFIANKLKTVLVKKFTKGVFANIFKA